MLTLFWIVFWAGLTGLMIAAGLSLRARLGMRSEAPPPTVDDDAVQRILSTGVIVTDEDEPLDLDEIEQEEKRFWSERWEEPDEW
jgi:hypothetical protein